jgi:RHS repeat-associated protein
MSRTALAGATPTPAAALMDQLTYRYASDTQGRLAANRLEHVSDTVADAVFPSDLDDQGPYAALNIGTHNYAYDAVGNLTRDRAAGITAVSWNMSSRVSALEVGGENIEFLYDGLDQRFAKIHKPSADPASWETEHFVRDENGRLLAVYRTAPSATAATPKLEELYLRGVGDIGVLRADRPLPATMPAGTFAQVRGDKQYQVSNYLGHVLVTVSDQRRPLLDAAGNLTGFEPWVLSTTDYDPFGAPSPGRFEETQPYRFGFNGYERDDDLKGAGNSYYTHERLFDPRLGRWLSPDPVQLAHSSPYAGFSNNPLRFGDPRGQMDWDSFKDTMENVAITTRDIGRDAAYVFSGAAVADAVAENLVKAKGAYDKGDTSEAIAHAIGIQDAIESLAQKDLDWQEGGATVEDRVRMGIGEVSGMNDVARAITGETEFAQELSTAERLQLGIQGGVKVVTIAAQGASIATSMVPKSPGGSVGPKPSVKSPGGPPCVLSFAPETPVWTAEGLRRIDEIQPGMAILALHPESGDAGEFEVTDVVTSIHDDGLRLVLARADGLVETLLTTSEHPFWRLGSGWVEAAQLREGDELHGDGGMLVVREIDALQPRFEAYNLTVEDAQSYLVGESGAWVHNCKKPPGHRATMTTKNKAGDVTHKNKLVSGGSGKGRRLSFKEQGEYHTEAKGTKLTRKRIKAGEDVGSLVFKGELPPCSMCKGKMNKLHRQKGVPSTYRDTSTGGTWKSSGKPKPKKKK